MKHSSLNRLIELERTLSPGQRELQKMIANDVHGVMRAVPDQVCSYDHSGIG
jgi:hypothetical protein